MPLVAGIDAFRDALHVIPLKMRAHIDLNKRHDNGEGVRRRNLTKVYGL